MSRRRAVLAVLAVVTAAGCRAEPEGWVPVLEGAPPSYLEREVERAGEEVAAAREELRSTPDAAEARLESAAVRLENLSSVFLPLYRAQIEATNAYRHHAAGHDGEAERALDEVEDAVVTMARETRGALEAELEQVSALVARSRVALEAGTREAGDRLVLLGPEASVARFRR